MSKMILTESELKKVIYSSVERILNEIKSDTFLSAADKSSDRGQDERYSNFYDAFKDRRNKELEEIFGPGVATVLDRDRFLFNNDNHEFMYNMYEDVFFCNGAWVSPGEKILRTNNRRFVRGMLEFFKRFKPDSQYNDKNLWIA